jgi:predicted dehydrogenase
MGIPHFAGLLDAAVAGGVQSRCARTFHGDLEETGAVKRIRVGIVGCGLIAQVMHLPHLRELGDRFSVTALCDLSERALAFAGAMFPEAARLDRWEDVVDGDVDAVLVLTPGSHAPIAIAAADAGHHVFAEKPMCVSVAEGEAMLAAAERSGVILMVGYMKRHDPAYEALAAELDRDAVVAARITTLESPIEPYAAHHPHIAAGDVAPEVLAALREDDDRRVDDALPGVTDPLVRHSYRAVLLDSMVHELNGVRGLLGEPDVLHAARIWEGGVTATLRFGATEAVFLWVDLPGIARYEQDWSFYGSDLRATLRFPSPLLRSEPTQLVLEGGEPGTTASWRMERTVSYAEAFKRELEAFHAAIVAGEPPRTGGEDALRDVMLSQAIVRSHVEGDPVREPTALSHEGAVPPAVPSALADRSVA